MKKHAHLLGHALNALIENKIVDMSSTKDADSGYLECSLLGESSVIIWRYIGYGEIILAVWWQFDKTKHPQHADGFRGIKPAENCLESFSCTSPLAIRSKYKDFVGVVCSTYVERKTGKYLQTDNGTFINDVYVRRSTAKDLMTIPDCVPNGFSLAGKVMF